MIWSICIFRHVVFFAFISSVFWTRSGGASHSSMEQFMDYILVNATHLEAIINVSRGLPAQELVLSSKTPLVGEAKGFVISPNDKNTSSHIMILLWPEVCDVQSSLFDIHTRVIAYLNQVSPLYRTMFVQDNVDKSLSEFITRHCRSHYLPVKMELLTEKKRRQENSMSIVPEIIWKTPKIALSSYTTLLQYYLRKLAVETWQISFVRDIAMEFSVEQFALSRFNWYPLSNLSILIDTSCISSYCRENVTLNGRNQREEDLLTLTLIRLKLELQEMTKKMVKVSIVYGYFVKKSTFSLFQEDCHFLTKFLQEEVTVVCTAMEVIEEAPDLFTSQQKQQHKRQQYEDEGIPLKEPIYSQRYYGDIREMLGQYAYKHMNSDYYYMMDLENIHFLQIPSLLTAWNRLHYGTLYPGFGILLHTSPILSRKKTTALEQEEEEMEVGKAPGLSESYRDINQYPFNPILPKSYFKIFTNDMHLFHPSFPRSLNNYLLQDVFDLFDGVIQEDTVLQNVYLTERETENGLYGQQGGSDGISIVNTYLLSFQMYNTILLNARHHVLAYLNNNEDSIYRDDAAIAFNRDDLDIQPGDAFYGLYCGLIVDMDGNLPIQCQSLLEQDSDHEVDLSVSTDRSERYGDHQINVPSKLYLSQSTEAMNSERKNGKGRVAVITAVYGDYEKSCKPFVRQTIPTDFFCFTDNPQILKNSQRHSESQRRMIRNGWIVDSTPYHLQDLQYEVENQLLNDTNAYHNNQHPFNIAKYYKTNFHRIAILQDYDVVIWIDGTIRIVNPDMSRHVWHVLSSQNETMMVFELPRYGSMEREAKASMKVKKYVSTSWLGFRQPYQNVSKQYESYVNEYGYRDIVYWQEYLRSKAQETGSLEWLGRKHYGVWCTCFVAFNMKMKKSDVYRFLDLWHNQIRSYTTQDQVSFPFVIQQLDIHPYSLPQGDIYGNYDMNSFFIKLNHGL